MRPAVTYTMYATSSKEQNGNVIMFTQFEEGNIWTEKLKLLGERYVQLHTLLWYMLEFRKYMFIFH